MENKVPTEEEKRKIYDYLKKYGVEGYFGAIVEDPYEVEFFLENAEEDIPVDDLTVWMLLNTK